LQFEVQHRFGGISGLITKNVASGFNGASGITVTNSGLGYFTVGINSIDTSGFDFKNYSFDVQRLDSGSRTVIAQGIMSVNADYGGG